LKERKRDLVFMRDINDTLDVTVEKSASKVFKGFDIRAQ